jgi:NADH:ubiquinone oxidoreductase subunit 2 (subunit N)
VNLMTLLAPELTLVIGAVVVLLLGLSAAPLARRVAAPLSVAAVLLALLIAWYAFYTNPVIESGLRITNLTWYVRVIALGVGVLVLLVHWPLQLRAGGSERSDLFAMVLFSLSGILLTSVADDLVLLFLAI